MESAIKRLLSSLLCLSVTVEAWAGIAAPTASDNCYNSITTGSAVSCTITNQPNAGDIIVFSGNAFSTLHITSVKDNAAVANTFTIPTGTNLTSGCDVTNGATAGSACSAYLIEPNGSGGKTFTFTASGTCAACSITIDRFPVTGGTAANAFAQGGHGTGSAITAPTDTASGSGNLIFGSCTDNSSCTGVNGSWTADPHGIAAFGEEAEFQTGIAANTAVGFTGSTATDPWDSTGLTFSFTASAATGGFYNKLKKLDLDE